MKKILIVTLVFAAVLSALDSRLEKADYYYNNRHKDSSYKMKVYNLCKEVIAENSSDAEALWRMARIYCTFGDDRTVKKDKIARYERARSYAEKAKAANSSSADAWFWYGVSIGRIGQTKGVLNSLSLAGPVKKAFLKALSLDSKHTGVMDGLGVWYREVPGVAGGDLAKSVTYLKKGLSIDPNYTLLYVDLGETYIKQKKYAEARAQLNKCLAITNPTHPADVAEDKADARKLLAEIEGK